METNVTLQNPLQFRLIWIILPILLIVASYLLWLYAKKKWPLPKKYKPLSIKTPPAFTRAQIRQKYLEKMNTLETSYQSGNITSRKAYQSLSSIIRNFVFEMTKIHVQNYTLAEIKTLNMPALSKLVEEYYEPEFARESNGEMLASLEKTRSVIASWN